MKVIECKKLTSLFQLLLTNNAYADPIIRNMEEIVESQSVDPVHAAGGCYCRECVYYIKTIDGLSYCTNYDEGLVLMNDNNFCGCGKLKEANQNG